MQRGALGEALELAEQLFWRRTTINHYDAVKRLAQQLGRWESVRAAIEKQLLKQADYDALTEVHLAEEEVRRAIERLTLAQETKRTAGYVGLDNLALRVARAAEDAFPLEAVRLYLQAAERLIARRGRGNYAEAAGLLARVRDCYRSMAREEDWVRCIERVRSDHSKLPALKDELRRAGL